MLKEKNMCQKVFINSKKLVCVEHQRESSVREIHIHSICKVKLNKYKDTQIEHKDITKNQNIIEQEIWNKKSTVHAKQKERVA